MGEFVSSSVGRFSKLLKMAKAAAQSWGLKNEAERLNELDSSFKQIVTNSFLAPYDLGVKQTTTVGCLKDEYQDRWVFSVALQRKMGNEEDWVDLNKNFVGSLRKQFLNWRSMPSESRKDYETRYTNLDRSIDW